MINYIAVKIRVCTAILNHTRHTTEAKRVYITKPILRKYPCLGEKKIFETSGTWIVFFKTSYSPSALERTCNNWYVKIHGVICKLYTLSIWKYFLVGWIPFLMFWNFQKKYFSYDESTHKNTQIALQCQKIIW